MGGRVDQKILGFDVAVTYSHGVDMMEGAAHLVNIEANKQSGHSLAVLAVVLADPVDRLWNVFQHEV